MRNSRQTLTAVLAALAVTAGCEGRDDLDGRRRPIPGMVGATETSADASGRRELAFDFIDNRPTALVHDRGALVASGRGSSVALVTGGGKAAGWRLGAGARPTIRVDGQVGHIRFPFDRDAGGIATPGGRLPIAMRFRPAARDQLVSLFLNGTKLGDVAMTSTSVAEYRTDAPADLLRLGENELRLFFRYAVADEGLRTAGSLERIAIGRGEVGTQSPLRVAPVDVGGERIDSLTFAAAARYSIHLLVPRTRPTLALRVTGSGPVSVRVADSSGTSKPLWQARANDSWQPADGATAIDLSEYAGQLVRVDLVSEGAASWGRPRVMRDPFGGPSTAAGGAADHVIVWLVAGLRASAIEGAPAIAALAKRGTARTALAHTPSWPQGVASMFAGRRVAGATLASDEETFAERFKQAGYRTAMVSNGRAFGGDGQGFDRVVRLPAARSDDLWKRALALVRDSASKRSLTVILAADPALPWTPDKVLLPPEWRNYVGRVQPTATQWLAASVRAGAPPLVARDREYVSALYGAEVAAVDAAIATMGADLTALGITERTAVVVASDRGQELFERGGFGDPTGLESDAVRVPLIVVAPGRSADGVAGPVLASDLYATVLDLGQIPAPARSDSVSVLTRVPRGRVALLQLPGKASGIAVGGYRWVAPVRAEAALYRLGPDGVESALAAAKAPVAARALTGWLSLLVAADGSWDRRRWGSVTALRPAFAAERGAH